MPVDRCDRIVNNGMGEPTECGRTLPCEYHDVSRSTLEDRILDVVREKHLSYAVLQKAEDAAGVPKGTKPSVEQLRAVVARLEAM